MADTNYPSATPQNQPPVQKSRTGKNLLIGLLAAGLLGTWGYVLWNNNQASDKSHQDEVKISSLETERNSVKDIYDQAVYRLDSITGANNNLTGEKTTLQKDIDAKRSEIAKILKKENASEAELKRARTLIAELNNQIVTLSADNARLSGENQVLTSNNTQLSSEKVVLEQNLQTTKTEKDELAQTVDVGSTFSAMNIQITPVNERKNGKEKVTTTAKRVDKLVISFDVENRIAKSGPADMYIMVTAPDGKAISDAAAGGSTLTTRTDGDKAYTAKVPVDYTQGTRKSVQFPIRQSDFQRGDYKIEIYHNGFKIGEGVRTLKKGGLFG
jgi:hypothetical protein